MFTELVDRKAGGRSGRSVQRSRGSRVAVGRAPARGDDLPAAHGGTADASPVTVVVSDYDTLNVRLDLVVAIPDHDLADFCSEIQRLASRYQQRHAQQLLEV